MQTLEHVDMDLFACFMFSLFFSTYKMFNGHQVKKMNCFEIFNQGIIKSLS